jgi:hypothetical protein
VSSVAPITTPGRGLLRALGLAFGIAAVIGDTVGVGIMRTSGPTAGRLGEPMLIYFVWLAVGIFVLLVANTLAELATAMPKAGGPYVYVRRAFGDYVGFVSGWGSFAVQVVAFAYLAIASSEFLIEIWPALDGHETLPATAAIVLFAAFNSVGLRASSAAVVESAESNDAGGAGDRGFHAFGVTGARDSRHHGGDSWGGLRCRRGVDADGTGSLRQRKERSQCWRWLRASAFSTSPRYSALAAV